MQHHPGCRLFLALGLPSLPVMIFVGSTKKRKPVTGVNRYNFSKARQVFAICKYKIQIARQEDCQDKYLFLCVAATYTKSVHPLFQRDNLFLQVSNNIS